MKDCIYLFYGFGSEYILSPLYEAIKAKGYECIEVEALSIKNSKKIINRFISKKVVFITSAHLMPDQASFTDLYPNASEFYGVLEIIQLLKPVRSVYIPHDLAQPLIRNELEVINMFDLFLTPCSPFTSMYSQFCRCEEVGWIKYRSNEKKIELKTPNRAIWLLSDFIVYLNIGHIEAFEKLRPVLSQQVSIKFPNWPGAEKFGRYFKKQGITVYAPNTSSIDLIRAHEIVITNGLSSINAESGLLGKTTVNIMEDSPYGEEKQYLEELIPSIIFLEKRTDFVLAKIHSETHAEKLKPFNTEMALQLITEQV